MTLGIVENEGSGYSITSGWKNEGLLSDLDAMYTNKVWTEQQQQRNNIIVTAIPFTREQIESDELINDTFIQNTKNKILPFVFDRNQQSIIDKWNGFRLQIKSLKQLRSNKRIASILKAFNTNNTKTKMVAIFIELKWMRESLKLSIDQRTNQNDQDSVFLSIFVYHRENAKINSMQSSEQKQIIESFDDFLLKREGDRNSDDSKEEIARPLIDENALKLKQEQTSKDDGAEAVIVKFCLLTKRRVWVTENFKKYPFNQLYFQCLSFSQFWLHLFVNHIGNYWAKHHYEGKQIKILPIRHSVLLIFYFCRLICDCKCEIVSSFGIFLGGSLKENQSSPTFCSKIRNYPFSSSGTR